MNVLRAFRGLLFAQPLLLVGALGFAAFGSDPSLSSGLDSVSSQEPDVLDKFFDWIEAKAGLAALIGILLCFLAAYIASLIGLYRCRRWGRTLFLIGFLVDLALVSFVSGEPVGPIESVLETLMFTSEGAILALAFLGPVADCINGDAPLNR